MAVNNKLNEENFQYNRNTLMSDNDEPSSILKVGLSSVAKIMLSNSKKIISKIILPYRPSISFKNFTQKNDIINLIEGPLANDFRNKIILRDIALNNIYTIDSAKRINDELIKNYHDEVDELKKAFGYDQQLNEKIQDSETFKRKMKELRETKSQLDGTSKFRLIYDFIKAIKENTNDSIVLINKIDSLTQKYPNWDNPVIADYLVTNFQEFSSDEEIISMLLSYYPTNKIYLKLAEKISTKENSLIFNEIVKLF